MIAITAELNRPPFDLVEAEQELVGGFHTEYSSIRFALFFLAEFMNTITMSAIAVTFFFGGPDGPGFHFLTWLWPILWFVGKTLIFLFCYVWVRAALPRLRYDQLMDLGWKVLIPFSLGWLLVIGAIISTNKVVPAFLWGIGILVGCLLAYLLLSRAIKVGRSRSFDVRKTSLAGVEVGRFDLEDEDVVGGRIFDLPDSAEDDDFAVGPVLTPKHLLSIEDGE